MTPEEEIAAKFRSRTNIPFAFYNGKKVHYFVEDNEDKYDLYFLVTDPHFDPDCNKDALHREFSKMKMYLHDEGFLDSCVKDVDREKNWKIHFLLQYTHRIIIIKKFNLMIFRPYLFKTTMLKERL